MQCILCRLRMIVLGTVFSKENLHLFTRKVFSGLQIKIGALTLKPFLILDSELKVKSVCDLCTQQPCCHLGEKLKPCSTVWGPFLPSDIQHFIEIFLICSLKGLVLHCHSFFVFLCHCLPLLLENHDVYPYRSVTCISEITADFEGIRLPKLLGMVSCLQ